MLDVDYRLPKPPSLVGAPGGTAEQALASARPRRASIFDDGPLAG
jgi:hypothetical protein